MKFALPFTLLFFLIPARAGEIWLKVGELRQIPAASEAVVRVGSRGIVRAVDSGQGITLIGLKPGSTSLVIDERNYLVRVSHSAQRDFGMELRSLLKKMMGLKMQADQKQLVVTGTLLRFSDWVSIAELARRHNAEYVFKARPLRDVAGEALKHFQDIAQSQGFPVARFSADNGFRVHIPKAAQGLKDAVERSFKPFGIEVEVTGTDLAVAPLVRTRVILAEVAKNFSLDFGVQWPSEYKAQVLPKIGAGEENTMAALRALEARGQAQILASPILLCRSGGQAQFHAGGEFPIRMVSRNARDVIWKPHGVLLHVKPQADFQGAISLDVETEVSLLDMSGAVDGVPAIKKNRVKSQFDLPGKRTIALSGLLRQELGEAKEGLPLLTRIPILGALFSSQKYLNHQSELVIFVTPEIYTPESDEPLKMPEGWVKRER